MNNSFHLLKFARLLRIKNIFVNSKRVGLGVMNGLIAVSNNLLDSNNNLTKTMHN